MKSMMKTRRGQCIGMVRHKDKENSEMKETGVGEEIEDIRESTEGKAYLCSHYTQTYTLHTHSHRGRGRDRERERDVCDCMTSSSFSESTKNDCYYFFYFWPR